MPLFTGTYEYSIDDKGRLSIPARHRDQVAKEEQDAVFFVTKIHPHCLSAYPPNEFQELVQNVSQTNDPNVRDLMRQLTSGAVECPVDQQGRIALPAELRAQAGLKRDVVVLGVAKRLEIWDRAAYRQQAGQALESGAAAYAAIKAPSDLV